MQGYYPNNNNYNNYNNYTANTSMIVVPVSGRAGAEAYPVGAGYTVFLIDFNTNQFWIKSTDGNAVPQRMREFNFDEVIPQPTNPNPDAVTRSEFENLNSKIDKLLAELGGK